MEYRNEKIIIDGRKRDCKILFSCKHVDDTAAYDMMCEGIEITPENAPVSDFELMLIEDTNDPFGFSLVCKRNNKEDVWEHMGTGNSGASSLITALLRTHEMGLKRILDLEKRIIKHSDEIEEYCNRLADKDHELKTICEAFEIECLKNTKTGEVTYRSNKLLRKEQECEELISEKDFYLQKIETLEDRCEDLKEENKELNKRNNFLLQRLEVDDTETSLVFKLQRELENSKSEFYHAVVTNVKLKNRNQQLDGAITKLKCYEQALDVIKSIVSSTLDCGEWIGQGDNKMENILEVINKAKGR